ncbi:hypothetical protein PR202_ga21321 [Eleusine coracana subsp. coracana]|uniref:Uncharacterized protein n=1 Tax=Eleusine coracana subsp. coracana TaxID=191504 RepID=A0AAV5D084_ELECO|nr:hypothetical protein PR202_ga21321 [Eleusine coracana subsp. coracana]
MAKPVKAVKAPGTVPPKWRSFTGAVVCAASETSAVPSGSTRDLFTVYSGDRSSGRTAASTAALRPTRCHTQSLAGWVAQAQSEI